MTALHKQTKTSRINRSEPFWSGSLLTSSLTEWGWKCGLHNLYAHGIPPQHLALSSFVTWHNTSFCVRDELGREGKIKKYQNPSTSGWQWCLWALRRNTHGDDVQSCVWPSADFRVCLYWDLVGNTAVILLIGDTLNIHSENVRRLRA